MDKLDTVVIGAGVVGLAIGRALALAGREVYILEQHSQLGQETSSRNSEVIHAGIYYPHNSLKASCCVEGKELLYRYCEERNIPHKRVSKLIVATTEDESRLLPSFIDRATRNGVKDLQLLTTEQTRGLEPSITSFGSILSPSTGIVDCHTLMMNYAADIENNGGQIVYNCQITEGRLGDSGIAFSTRDNPEQWIACNYLVNAAGLHAPHTASALGVDHKYIPEAFYAKGHYYSLSGKSPFNHLVYPLPGHAGLGIHATHDLSGRVKFGPDVEWITKPDYSFDSANKHKFVEAIRRYYPQLEEAQLVPDYTGIRPKISGPTAPAADFIIQGPKAHGIKGLCNLFGIESPGLTSSLAIANRVLSTLDI